MKKVFFVVGPALGHLGRSLVIGKALAATGPFQIYFACVSPGWGEQIISEEFPFYKLSSKQPGDTLSADALESVISQLKPDLISTSSAAISSGSIKVKTRKYLDTSESAVFSQN